MKTISEKQLGSEFLDALEGLNKMEEESLLINLHGQKFVVLKEDDYRGWRETSYLLSSSKNSELLSEALEEPLGKCTDLKDVLKKMDS